MKKWQKPPLGVVKVNNDASVRGNGFIGVGITIRDNNGLILGT